MRTQSAHVAGGKGCGGGSYRRRPSALANEYFIEMYFFTLGILIEL